MLNRDPERERPRREGLTPDRLAWLRRALRWANLTLVQQAVWPLLIVVVAAPPLPVASTPGGWFAARVGAPLLAAVLAAVYLAQHPERGAAGSTSAALVGRATSGPRAGPAVGPAVGPVEPAVGSAGPAAGSTGPAAGLRFQARVLLVGLAASVAVLRLVVGPVGPVAKLLLFGAADVAAFHLIHYGVVARSVPRADAIVVGLFGVSWGLRELLLAAIDRDPAVLPFAFAGGLAVGLAVGAMGWGLRQWLGGWLPAAAAHWLLVYLVAGFIT